MSVIDAVHLSRWYGQVLGLNDVTTSVGPGITALLGPNGAGKSTLLWILTGQLKPSQGDVKVYGECPWGNVHVLRRVGFCPESDGFWPNLRGIEFVTLLARLSGVPAAKARDRAAESIETVGLAEAKDRRVGTYSKGMRQRLKFAQALAHDPDLLILDEPLAGMDPLGRRDMLALIRRLAEGGKDILIASHVLHEVERLTSRILVMNRGRVLADGDVHEIRALIDRHPHSVRVECDRPRDLARDLVGAADIVAVGYGRGNSLTVRTTAPDAFYDRLADAIIAGGYRVEMIDSEDDNLETVFKYLTE